MEDCSIAQQELFLSEVHTETCPPGEGEWTTVFHGECSLDGSEGEDGQDPVVGADSQEPLVDEDGDLLVPRGRRRHCFKWEVRHCRKTVLGDVGTQVWGGAVVLAEYILSQKHLFQGKTVLEFGCGVGFVGMALGNIARSVYLTDNNTQALCLAKENLRKIGVHSTSYQIRNLDWKNVPDLGSALSTEINEGMLPGDSPGMFDWSMEDFAEIAKADIFLAADVIFDDEATDSFLLCLKKFMDFSESHGRSPECVLSVERRINFTIKDLEARAPAYDYSMQYVQKNMHQGLNAQNTRAVFKGMHLDIQQVPEIFSVRRSSYLELWKLMPLAAPNTNPNK